MLFEAIKKYTERRADIDTATVVNPYGIRGLTKMQAPGGELVMVASGPGITWAPGTQLPVGSHLGGPNKVILQNPAPGRRGASARPPLRSYETNITGPAVHRLVPGVYQVGQANQPGTAQGVGFSPHHLLVITFHHPATGLPVVDERFTLHTQERISSREITFLLDASPEAPAGTVFDVAVIFE